MEEKKSNAGQGLGIAGLVLGIIALIISFIPCLGIWALVPGIVAIVLSFIALSQANKANASKGLIIAALIVSILATIIAGVWGYVIKKSYSSVKSAVEMMDTKSMEELSNSLKPFEGGQAVSDADFDKFITNYEKFISDAAKLKEKAKNNDLTAAAAFIPVGLKFAEIAMKLESARPNLTPDQVKKLDDLNNKFSKEMEDLKK
ncbi:MAG TPA: DUF4190 domain-containing protein [Bacteroidales bacterium]|nr:DUF4190 domain-containing protein [Bacteroidales bacterium]